MKIICCIYYFVLHFLNKILVGKYLEVLEDSNIRQEVKQLNDFLCTVYISVMSISEFFHRNIFGILSRIVCFVLNLPCIMLYMLCRNISFSFVAQVTWVFYSLIGWEKVSTLPVFLRLVSLTIRWSILDDKKNTK